ncbi:putative secreted protein [Litoreibacter meonggei]|uniref:Putative secreted protein n=1 Tax=Litoreibacter meonggei TaxID=1049199 RepID=A0A497UZP2_9RHOB|nr:lectin-like protein [Litoreibacter meonggei]RLJ36332.1 putative secreted protein [Litoreibacter meonggei]
MKSILLTSALALAISAPAHAAPIQWEASAGGNDHWYEIIYLGGGPITWNQAKASAESKSHLGETGYLASITSAAEQAFANAVNLAFSAASPYHNGYVQAWLGGNDIATEGAWEWTTGEDFSSYSNFAWFEPNNYFGEDHLVGWWSGDRWNDCDGTCGTYKYLIEYNGATPPAVPLPASLPLLGFAIAGIAGLSRKRKKAA